MLATQVLRRLTSHRAALVADRTGVKNRLHAVLAERLVKPQEKTVYEVVKGGGRVVAGTDAPINPYGLSLLMELENYAAGGLTPAEVLRTATTVSAEAMGVGADIGSIEPGKRADLTFIDGDPLSNIKDLRRVRRVMKDERIYDVSALIAGR